MGRDQGVAIVELTVEVEEGQPAVRRYGDVEGGRGEQGAVERSDEGERAVALPDGPFRVLGQLRGAAEPADDRGGPAIRCLLQAQSRPQQADPPFGDPGGQVRVGEGVQRVDGALCHVVMMHGATDSRPWAC